MMILLGERPKRFTLQQRCRQIRRRIAGMARRKPLLNDPVFWVFCCITAVWLAFVIPAFWWLENR